MGGDSLACSSSCAAAGDRGGGTGLGVGRHHVRRGPRISVQLTPLPRVTLEFDRNGRRAGGPRSSGCSGAPRPPRWQPSAGSRAAAGPGSLPQFALGSSGGLAPAPYQEWGPYHPPSPEEQQLLRSPSASQSAAAAAPDADAADAVFIDGRELSGVRAAPAEATASLGADDLPADCGAAVAAAVGETHLLQFGAMLGEASCRDALARAEAAGPVGSSSGSLYGSPDTDAFFGPWEAVVQETAPGVLYWGWRRPLRRGLYLYMTRSVFLGATPSELRAFMLDDAGRLRWDKSMAALGPALAAARNGGGGGAAAGQRESDVMHAAVRFPKPLGQRSYTYARRVWARPCDGGCYVLSRACGQPAACGAGAPPRGVAVTDYCSGAVIRSPPAGVVGADYEGPAAECLMIYFEDSHVRAGLANLGIKKGLWPMLQRTDRALRSYIRAGGADAGADAFAGCCGSSATAPCTPRSGAPAAASANPARPGGGLGLGLGGLLRCVGAPLRALASAAGALLGLQARVASLLPRLELRLLRWLASRVVSGSATAFARIPAPQLLIRGAGSAAATPAPSAAAAAAALRRVGSHPLCDFAAGPPRLARSASVGAAAAGGLVRVGSHPLAVEDLSSSLDAPETPSAPAALLSRSPSAPARGSPQQQQQQQQPCACCERGRLASVGAGWPDSRLVAAEAFEPRPRCRAYPASCPAASRAGSDASGPVSVGGASCAATAAAAAAAGDAGRRGGVSGGLQRRRSGGRLVMRLIQAATVRAAHKLLSSLDAQQQ
ncbi:hypothetical protein MNEG_9376 [Monoraphidium neglectum]|uniref:START domain-containing protein n=1 Tax=Monoraphidium neglectum TaxID=145388 RepID=A0A0D2MCM5_9CHLO|nr:hypothetical protein MNEG_9376 [Monoraphidium neglectum]KIY98586.1 hypothetical protein MNEG_9376 [Monoraphidium neglectum]|eukprot:XP_013897606.1 hypothetical protein MNEG_9376 [Monoraphidium neglectum]